jgi:hypothetical protein
VASLVKEHYPDAEQKDYWKAPYSDVKNNLKKTKNDEH